MSSEPESNSTLTSQEAPSEVEETAIPQDPAASCENEDHLDKEQGTPSQNKKEPSPKADKEWVKMEKIPEKKPASEGRDARKNEATTKEQEAFEDMWNKAIQDSRRNNNHLTQESHRNNHHPTKSPTPNHRPSTNRDSPKSRIPPAENPSVTKRFLRHVFQALLDLTHTNYTAFAVNLLWHGLAVYYLSRPRKALLTNAVVSGGKGGVPPYAIDTVKFLGGVHAAWALLSLLSFRIKDITAQKAILLAFSLANFSHLYFTVSALASGRWRLWFTKITAGSSIVTLINIACYLASVKKNGRYL
ncbi:hypothetical protein K493DRAFT_319469 [Basidiobolus meristosporus CBS 931.73]|uniref:Uncharacterized protein n=1 Tax=Basidiobolus meristosporus CBS 931.73 TaxID=1314790 RepID=A0A1Y1XRT1_9FUNG|nr:hypothetical protein K493DRAFT_319469 [Basidiobolus meristosporus CBS 931.73]|eukprot:ORX88443.1 hypothetical protein K493DRAFT_319469 [Basidiobolus meristosporus CBS 931.73]